MSEYIPPRRPWLYVETTLHYTSSSSLTTWCDHSNDKVFILLSCESVWFGIASFSQRYDTATPQHPKRPLCQCLGSSAPKSNHNDVLRQTRVAVSCMITRKKGDVAQWFVKHHAIKRYRVMEVCLHSFLTSALDTERWLTSRPRCFTPRELAAGYHWIGDLFLRRIEPRFLACSQVSTPTTVFHLQGVVNNWDLTKTRQNLCLFGWQRKGCVVFSFSEINFLFWRTAYWTDRRQKACVWGVLRVPLTDRKIIETILWSWQHCGLLYGLPWQWPDYIKPKWKYLRGERELVLTLFIDSAACTGSRNMGPLLNSHASPWPQSRLITILCFSTFRPHRFWLLILCPVSFHLCFVINAALFPIESWSLSFESHTL